MRQIILLILAFTAFTFVTAQSKIPVPEFKNTINQVNTVTKTLKNLEKATAELETIVKAMGIAGGDMYLKISGSTSSVKLEPSQTTFVVKLPDSDTDPSSYVELYKYVSDKDGRRVKIGSQNVFGKKRNIVIPKINLEFSKISAGIYLITTSQTLEKGSYGFIVNPTAVITGISTGVNQSSAIFAFDIN